MFTRTLTIWDTVRTSLWALPLAIVLAAGASATWRSGSTSASTTIRPCISTAAAKEKAKIEDVRLWARFQAISRLTLLDYSYI